MRYAVKANKVYQVDDASKEIYKKQGYDIVDENGNIVEHSPVSTVPYSKYEELQKKYEELEKKAEDGAASSIYDVLLGYANKKGIDIGQTTSEEGILKKIKEAEK